MVCLAAFAYAEHRAAEPILPLRLFRGNVFSVSSVLSFIVGFALLVLFSFVFPVPVIAWLDRPRGGGKRDERTSG